MAPNHLDPLTGTGPADTRADAGGAVPPDPGTSRPGTPRPGTYERIRRWVMTTDFPIGYRLRPTDIASSLSVSATPVREALIRLSCEGLIENHPGSGFFVPLPRVEEALALNETRRFLVEGCLSRDDRAPGWTLAPANGRAVRESLRSRDPSAVAGAWSALDDLVVATLGNEVLVGLVRGVDARLHYLRVMDAEDGEAAEAQAGTIEDILSALAAGDGGAARDRLAAHGEGFAGRIPRLVERRIVDGLQAGNGSAADLAAAMRARS